MKTREQIIKAFEQCLVHGPGKCEDCYQDGPGLGIACWKNVCSDVLALLKEQEPVKPREEKCGKHWDLDVWTYVCGECGSAIDTVDVYCRHCGREVKWDA